MVRARSFLVVAALLAWGTSCGDDDSASSDDESASGRSESVDSSPLIAAAETSLTAESYVMTVSGPVSGGEAIRQASGQLLILTEGETIYQAPDRVLVRAAAEEGRVNETFVVGHDILVPDFPRPGRYARYDVPEDYIANSVQLPLRLLLDVEVVDVNGDTYEFRIEQEGGAGRAVIRGGLVREMTVHGTFDGRQAEVSYSFARYGSAPAVEPPDSSLIDEGATAPACGEDGPSGGQVFCLDPS
jgi:hypothetical protein